MRGQVEVERLWILHADEVHAFVRRRVGCSQLAEDITSEVFVTVARSFETNAEVDIHAGFLFTVARRRIVDSWRQRERGLRLVEQCGRSLIVGDAGDEQATLEGLMDLEWLDRMPARQRTALVLRYVGELSVGEVAERMGESYGVVESLLARGRRSARRLVDAVPLAA